MPLQILIGFFIIYLIYALKIKKHPAPACHPPQDPGLTMTPIIGYKTAWLAVREDSPTLVINALGLERPETFDWSADLNQVGKERRVFVSPSVNGWVQIIGMPDLFKRTGYLNYVAKRFPEVQFFITHRVVEYHGWAKYADGRLVRNYLWCGERGEVLCSNGDLTPEEQTLGFDRFPQPDEIDWNDPHFPDEQDVHRIAAAWGGTDGLPDEEREFREPGYLCSLPEWAAILG